MESGRRGKKAAFSPEQNAALRAVLVEVAKLYSSEKSLGGALGVAQQNAGNLLKGRQGFSWQTADALLRLAGHEGVDSFFASRGLVSTSLDSTTNITDGDVIEDCSVHSRQGAA